MEAIGNISLLHWQSCLPVDFSQSIHFSDKNGRRALLKQTKDFCLTHHPISNTGQPDALGKPTSRAFKNKTVKLRPGNSDHALLLFCFCQAVFLIMLHSHCPLLLYSKLQTLYSQLLCRSPPRVFIRVFVLVLQNCFLFWLVRKQVWVSILKRFIYFSILFSVLFIYSFGTPIHPSVRPATPLRLQFYTYLGASPFELNRAYF